MRMALHPYQLSFHSALGKRSGYLLKISSSDFEQGFSDIFPWPEFGDPSLPEIPSLLREGDLSHPLLKRSIEKALVDGRARESNHKLLENKKLSCHFTVTGLDQQGFEQAKQALSNGFCRFKLKLGRQMSQELEWIEKWCMDVPAEPTLRLDFNQRAQPDFLKQLQVYSPYIEFIEDPFDQPDLWSGISLSLAYDQPPFEYQEVKTSWQVIKPAKQTYDDIFADQVVFTNYLGHPVGTAHDFLQASQWGPQKVDYGFFTHHLIEATNFHPFLKMSGANLFFEPGIGIGFGELLDKLEWKDL